MGGKAKLPPSARTTAVHSAAMPRQIRGDGRPSPCRQIVRRGHEEAPRLAEGPQLQRAVRERPQPKRDIHAFTDEVHPLIREAEVNSDVGMAVLKSEDQPADVQDSKSRRAAYPDRAGGRAARASGLIAGLFDEAQDLNAVGIIAAAFGGHRHTSGRSAEQRHADRFFELPHMICRLSGDCEICRISAARPTLPVSATVMK